MLTVADLMTEEVFSLREYDNLQTAQQLMNLARIRHIPIVAEDQRFVGLVTHRDILEAAVSRFADVAQEERDELNSGIPVAAIMRSDVRAVTPDMPLREAAALLLGHKYGCLPVIEKGNLVGILTEADFLKLTISLMDSLEDF